MQILDRIDAILKRAEAINLPLSRLCARAGVHYSTICRWRAGGDIKLHNADAICTRLEAELMCRETEMLDYLAGVVERRCVEHRAV